MPNWNSNNLTIKGNVKDVLAFIKENFRTAENPYKNSKIQYDYILDFEVSQPTPERYVDDDVIDDWYAWRNTNWGCKWSASFEQCISLILTLEKGNKLELIETFYNVERDDHKKFDERLINALIVNKENNTLDFDKAELNVYFETPWGPPTGMFKFWHERFNGSSLEFDLKFYESGCAFAGYLESKLGEENKHEYEETYYGICEDEVAYKTYLLEEGWEDVESEMDYLIECLEEMHSSDMSKEMLDKLIEKVKETLDSAETTEHKAILITDIRNTYRKWRDEEIEIMKTIDCVDGVIKDNR